MAEYILGRRYGLEMTTDTDTDHDIKVDTGQCRASNAGVTSGMMVLDSVLTKQIDAAWAVSDDAGGMFTGAVAADTKYYFFLIRKDSDSTVDAGFDTSSAAANIPAGYTLYRQIGFVTTDGSSNILPFKRYDDEGLNTVIFNQSADDTFTLPAASGNNGLIITFDFQQTSDAIITIDGNAAETISGRTSIKYIKDEYLRIECDGSNWRILSEKLQDVVISVDRNGAQQDNVLDATWTVLKYDTERIDSHGWYDTTTFKFTPKAPGTYMVVNEVSWVNFTNNKLSGASFFKNGTMVHYRSEGFNNAITPTSSLVGTTNMNGSSDYMEFRCYQNTGSTRSAVGNTDRTFGAAYRVSNRE